VENGLMGNCGTSQDVSKVAEIRETQHLELR
jgi:hypothetical protein